MPIENQLFARNLPFNVNQSKLKALFGHFGAVKKVQIFNNAKYKNSSALVEYLDKKSALDAKTQLKNQRMNGKLLNIEFALSPTDFKNNNKEKQRLRKLKKSNSLKRRHPSTNPRTNASPTSANTKSHEHGNVNGEHTHTPAHKHPHLKPPLAKKRKLKLKATPPCRVLQLTGISNTIAFNQIRDLFRKTKKYNKRGVPQFIIFPIPQQTAHHTPAFSSSASAASSASSASSPLSCAWALYENVMFAKYVKENMKIPTEFSAVAGHEDQESVAAAAIDYVSNTNKMHRIIISNLPFHKCNEKYVTQLLRETIVKHYNTDNNRRYSKAHRHNHGHNHKEMDTESAENDATPGVLFNHLHIPTLRDNPMKNIGLAIIECRKIDYALLFVQKLNHFKIDDREINVRFELQKRHSLVENHADQKKTQHKEIDNTNTDVSMNTSNNANDDDHKDGVHDAFDGGFNAGFNDGISEIHEICANIVLLSNVAKTITFDQLKESLSPLIDNASDLTLLIYPSPDTLSTMTGNSAWICLQSKAMTKKLIKHLNLSSISHQTVFAKYLNGKNIAEKSDFEIINPCKVIVRNIHWKTTKNQLVSIMKQHGIIDQIHVSVASKALVLKQTKFAFVTYTDLLSAHNAIQALNGYSISNQPIAVDYTLPKYLYSKLRQQQQTLTPTNNSSDGMNDEQQQPHQLQEQKTASNLDDINHANVKKKVPIWKKYEFMSDFDAKITNKYRHAYVYNNKKKSNQKSSKIFDEENFVRQRVKIPIYSEPTDYDWLKFFLKNGRLSIIQMEMNCKLWFGNNHTADDNEDNNNSSQAPNYVEIISDNDADLHNGIALMNELLNHKFQREIGYQKMLEIPFVLEENDFDWIEYLCGENNAKRREFECKTGCFFSFEGKLSAYVLQENSNDFLKLNLIAMTPQCLQRGIEAMVHFHLSAEQHSNEPNAVIGQYQFTKRIRFENMQQNNANTISKKNKKKMKKKQQRKNANANLSPNQNANIDCISIICGYKNENLKQLQMEFDCKIRVFGGQFINKQKNNCAYCKIMAKTAPSLIAVEQKIYSLIEANASEAKLNANRDTNIKSKGNNNINTGGRFWFYSGDAKEKRTLFVGNLPLDINNEAQIASVFGKFGEIVLIQIVRDKITKNPKGTCFVQFSEPAAVMKAMEAQEIYLRGRLLWVKIALDKNEMNSNAGANASKKSALHSRKMDKRNLYLAKEGIILAESEMENMTKQELQMRINSWTNKKTKLENLNFHISDTRLSLKNLPLSVNEKQLKKIFIQCALDVRRKHGQQSNNHHQYKYPFPKILQCKVVQNEERQRSKRYGFIQFREHFDSFLCLKKLNNKFNFDTFFNNNVNKSNDRNETTNANNAKNAAKNNTKLAENRHKYGRLQIEFALQNMVKMNVHNEKVKKHQFRSKNIQLQKLSETYDILIAQKQFAKAKTINKKIHNLRRKVVLK